MWQGCNWEYWDKSRTNHSICTAEISNIKAGAVEVTWTVWLKYRGADLGGGARIEPGARGAG